ncbi:hypothetical protein BH18ACT4_BH18ACT4_09440 [soil metagenome]
MTRRTPAELDLLMKHLGTDLELRFLSTSGMFADADLQTHRQTSHPAFTAPVDLAPVAGIPAAVQMLVNRLKAGKGELAALGHPEYGSRHHELVGEPNVERTRNLVKLYVLEALSQEPRIEDILECRVYAPHDPPRDQVRIELQIRLLDQPNPLNLVVPFSLAVGV